MNVGVLGSGGREHALAWILARSPKAERVVVLPGNAGTPHAEDVDPTDPPAVAAACRRLELDLLVVGGEEPLAAGVVDHLAGTRTRAVGPTASAARLEASKLWAKRFMARHGIPTAEYVEIESASDVERAARAWGPRLVVKADGLAAGKGVVVCDSARDAIDAWTALRRIRPAGEVMLAERALTGRELSILCLTDGRTYRLLPPARDYKAAYDGDVGPNTGGMGSFAPAPVAESQMDEIVRTIVEPTLDGLRDEEIRYGGFLYFGLMLTADGAKILEYNVRLGDPEAEVLLPLLADDLLEPLVACADGGWDGQGLSASGRHAVDVVLGSEGYPGSYRTGLSITGLDLVDSDVLVFHGATRRERGEIVTAGGRVLHVVGVGDDRESAVDRAYRNAARISFEGMRMRRDIGRSAG